MLSTKDYLVPDLTQDIQTQFNTTIQTIQNYLKLGTGSMKDASTMFRIREIVVPAGHSQPPQAWKALIVPRQKNSLNYLSKKWQIALELHTIMAQQGKMVDAKEVQRKRSCHG